MNIETKCLPPYLFNLIVRVLDQQNKDSNALVSGVEFDLSDLAKHETRISYLDALHMIRNAYKISGDEQLGLTVAAQVNIGDWGMMGYAVASCDNLGESLIIGQRYNRAATRLTDNKLDKNERVFCFQSIPLFESGDQERFLAEEDLGGVVNMVNRYLDDKARPLEVHLCYDAPHYYKRYEEHFRCPVLFNQAQNQIVWDTSTMECPIPLRNPAATQLAIQQCERLIKDNEDKGTMVDKVKSQLVTTPGKYPSINEVAAELNTSESSLRRSLKALGTSYQSILNDVRKKLAIEYLTTSNLKLEDIAYLVGYSDLSNFRRAFRTWTGVPPLQYRVKK